MKNVLVVLLNYNSPQDTYRCLESLAASAYQVNVVVVDNASTGGGLVEETKVKALCANSHVIFNPKNAGFGGGNNLGIEWGLKHTDADYFFILNNDTVVTESAVEKLVQFIEADPTLGMCSPAIFHLQTPDVFWFGGGYIDWRKGGALSPNVNKAIGTDVAVAEITFISGCAMFLRRGVLEKLGGFSDDYFMYCEDVDYCARALNAGYRIGYDSTTQIFHNAHSSVIKGHDSYIVPHSWKNKSAPFFIKHYVYGALLNLSKHARGRIRFLGTLSVVKSCLKWSLGYIRHGRFDAIGAMFVGVRYYFLKVPPK